VSLRVQEAAGVNPYRLELRRTALGEVIDSTGVLDSYDGGTTAASGRVLVNLVPSSPEVVSPQSWYELTFDTGGAVNGVCSIEVAYTR
jgi:hypothetical protein